MVNVHTHTAGHTSELIVSKYSPLMDLYFASVYHSKQSKNDQLIQISNLIK